MFLNAVKYVLKQFADLGSIKQMDPWCYIPGCGVSTSSKKPVKSVKAML